MKENNLESLQMMLIKNIQTPIRCTNKNVSQISMACLHLSSVLTVLLGVSFQFGIHSQIELLTVHQMDYHSSQTLNNKIVFLVINKSYTIKVYIFTFQTFRYIPKHLLRLVCLSIKTLAEITFPNGIKVCAKSASLNSCGRWYINKFAPSGPTKRMKEKLYKNHYS